MLQTNNLIDRNQAAKYLGIEPQTLAVWACNKRYDLPYIKVGRRVMYQLSDINAFIDRNRVGNALNNGGCQ
jgi:hypothetical protein